MFETGVFFGVSDRVIVDDGGKLRDAYVGFYDVDTRDQFHHLVRNIAHRLSRDIHVFRTNRGYHFVAFDITDYDGKRQYWEAMRSAFGGDYPIFKENCLRISSKEGQKPIWLYAIHTDGTLKPVSGYHVRCYRPLFGLSSISTHFPNIARTHGHLWQYGRNNAGVWEIEALPYDVRRTNRMG